MDLDTKKYLKELIENNSIGPNNINEDEVQRPNLVDYVDSDDSSNIEIFGGNEFNDLDYSPPEMDSEYKSDDLSDISDFEITKGKRKKESKSLQQKKKIRTNEMISIHETLEIDSGRVSENENEVLLNENDFELKSQIAPVLEFSLSDDNHQHSIKKSGLESILESLNTLQKETAKLEYRVNIIERTSMLPISSHTVHRFDGVISESVSLGSPSLYFELPLKTKEEADEFESKLKGEQFRNSIIKQLDELYGNTTSVDTKQALSTIVNKLFSSNLLSQYTWTGKTDSKSTENRKKYAFKTMKEILDLILHIMKRVDDNYSVEKLNRELTYNILKYAYKLTKMKNECHEVIMTLETNCS